MRARSLVHRFGSWLMSLVRLLWERSWGLSILVGGFLLMALGSYSRLDPSFSVNTAADPQNWCGFSGAYAADLMLLAFGQSAWWFVLGCFMIAFFAFRSAYRRRQGETDPRRINPPRLSAAVGFIAILLGSTCLEALRMRRFQPELPGDPGGIMGDSLAFGIRYYIGVGLSTVLFFVLIAIGLSLLMDFQWSEVAEKIGEFLFRRVIGPLRGLKADKTAVEDGGKVVAPAVTPAPAAAAGEAPRIMPAQLRREPLAEAAAADGGQTAAPQTTARPPAAPVVAARTMQPSMDLLDEPGADGKPEVDRESLAMTGRMIVAKLKSYNIEATVKGAQTGPVITQFWLEPGPSVKGSQIEGVQDDLRRALGVQSVRIVPSIPNTSYIGLEVPNPVRETVRLKEVLCTEEFKTSKAPLLLALGKDIAGVPYSVDLAKMPHLLVAGTTGSGKSVGINAMILSMLYRNDPSNLRLVLIDPKMLEFSLYNDIPHLLCPVVTDMNKASTALKWLTSEMDRRYAVMSHIGVRHFTTYNEKVRQAQARGEPIVDPTQISADGTPPEPLEPWPYIVCIVDELADLIMTNRKEVESEITRLTQKARAAGMHLIIATQRPSADVVTSLIKANVPTRISFQVASAVDSRVILGESGGESLLGWGDMLIHRPGQQQATRVQGCFVDDDEVIRVAEDLKRQGRPEYVSAVTDTVDGQGEAGGGTRKTGEDDARYDEAVGVVLRERRASISFVQRQLGIGYNRAANILEAMEANGVVSKPSSSGKREILVPQRD